MFCLKRADGLVKTSNHTRVGSNRLDSLTLRERLRYCESSSISSPRLLHGRASAKMAIPRTCTFLHQLLLSSLNPSIIALNRASLQSSINSPLHDIGSRTIVLLVLLSIALQTWGWSSPSFLVSSILCICSSLSMTPIIPADAVFFLGWPTWAKLAVVSQQSLWYGMTVADWPPGFGRFTCADVHCKVFLLLILPDHNSNHCVLCQATKLEKGHDAGKDGSGGTNRTGRDNSGRQMQ